jgi:hypothetical protein
VKHRGDGIILPVPPMCDVGFGSLWDLEDSVDGSDCSWESDVTPKMFGSPESRRPQNPRHMSQAVGNVSLLVVSESITLLNSLTRLP